MSKRRPSQAVRETGAPLSRTETQEAVPAAWQRRVFRNSFTRRGRSFAVKSWAFKVQFQGFRRTFSLGGRTRAAAAREAQQLHDILVSQGWDAARQWHRSQRHTGAPMSAPIGPLLSARGEVAYWEQRLIQRRYHEARLVAGPELSARVEHEGAYAYFPLGSCDPKAAAARALEIHQAVVAAGWTAAFERFDREITLAISWADNPLAVTYTTVFTFVSNAAPRLPQLMVGDRLRKRVVVLEPDPTLHGCLRHWLDQQPGFACAGVFRTAVETLAGQDSERAVLVLANRAASDLVQLTQPLKARRPELPVFPYRIHEDSDQVWTSISGVSGGYILRRRLPAELFDPLHPAARSRSLAAPEALHLIRGYFQNFFGQAMPEGELPGAVPLTTREQEILSHVSKGFLDKEIAHLLNISIWTVHNHVKNIYEKLGVHNRTEAALKLLQK